MALTALENLIKILKLEQDQGFQNKAVIGGLKAYAPNWAKQARLEAKSPEQFALIEELLRVIDDYDSRHLPDERLHLSKYIQDRIMRRREADPEYRVDALEAMPREPSEAEPLEIPDTEIPGADPRHIEVVGAMASEEPLDWLEVVETIPPDRVSHFAPKHSRRAKPLRRGRRKSLSPEEAAAAQRTLDQPLTVIPGFGPAMAEKFHRIGPQTVGDLISMFPRRYDDYTKMLPLRKLPPGERVTVIGTIKAIHERVGSGNRKMLVLKVDDGTGQIDVTFFNQPWLKRQLQLGMQLVFSGKTDLFLGKVTMTNPEWEPVDQESLHTGGLVPIYPLTKGITARTMRRLMKKVIEEWAERVPDHLPDSVLERTEQVDLGWALRQMHFPENWDYLNYARERIAFDQLISLQLGVLANRYLWQSDPAVPLHVSEEWLMAFENQLPFRLTGAQHRAITEILNDMSRDIPMNRLLQGDVGAGKTLVAAVAMAAAVLNGQQAALMAPTSILAEQHFQKLRELFATIPGLEDKQVALLTGTLTPMEREIAYRGLADGSISFVIGTHAVIQQGVELANLAVAVIDEQHRFGVAQRGALRGKGMNPHLLIMSATPIPRTLALTVHADLDLSILDEMPPGRTPITTKLITPDQRMRAYEFIENRVLVEGQQVYIVYPLVESSEALEDVGSAVEGFQQLQKEIYPKYRLGLMHGRLKPAEKDTVMAAFASGELDVLVSTSVIEVGVDVPNATAIMIEGADRFGLAQLHQFRGRVGRGDKKSYCLLVAEESTERLEALEQTTDGFKLAELDWELRGAGDLLGLQQSGGGQHEIARAMDPRLVALAQQESRTLYAEDPLLELPEHTLLRLRVYQITNRDMDVS